MYTKEEQAINFVVKAFENKLEKNELLDRYKKICEIYFEENK